ncbi:MAG: hypothetical protein SWK90_17900 [Chloroflexota bacterium]|nr:hypothetical protein [Chloroflexota bacterium]
MPVYLFEGGTVREAVEAYKKDMASGLRKQLDEVIERLNRLEKEN